MWGAELSPDGQTMAFFQTVDDKLQMTVVDPRKREVINGITFGKGAGVEWIRWIDNDRMLINGRFVQLFFGQVIWATRLIIARPKEGTFEFLVEDPRSPNGGQVLHISKDKTHAIIAHRGDGYYFWPTVYRYELKPGGEVTKLHDPKKGVSTWIADETGAVRLGMGWRRGKVSIYYREADEDEFRRIARFKPNETEKFFDAVQIIGGSSRGYVLDENDEGRVGLRVFDYETREVVETFYENPDWDLEDVWLDDDGQPLAAFYTDDRSQVVWFNEEYKASYDLLKSALGDRDIWITSRSDDGKTMLVWAGNEADPGVLYLFDAKERSLGEFMQYRPDIDFRMLAKPEAISYTARDGTKIRAYLTLPLGRQPSDLPLIILPHGGPFGIRDELRYNDEVQFLANRGYAVLQPNFRGSGGYGNEFYDLGNGEVGRGMQDDLDDAMDWAVAQGFADPERVCLVGGSYGGYAALWGVLRNPERYRCAASWAGVTDWTRMLQYDRRVLTRQAGKRWTAKIEGDEDLSLKDVSPYRLAERLTRPVLLAHGTLDDNVPFKQYEQMVKAARKARAKLTTLVIEDEGHSFSRAQSEQEWYDALDTFLAKHNPADQVTADGSLKPIGQSVGVDIVLPDQAATP